MVGMMDRTYDVTFFNGARAIVGTTNAFLDHTLNSKTIYNYYVNGKRVGELILLAILPAHFNTPLMMVTGDAAAIQEAKSLQATETVVVKSATERNCARLMDVHKSHQNNRESARRVTSLKSKTKLPVLSRPMEIRIEFTCTDCCDSIARRLGEERISARGVRRITNDVLDLLPSSGDLLIKNAN
jgi:D-aminopeptidase